MSKHRSYRTFTNSLIESISPKCTRKYYYYDSNNNAICLKEKAITEYKDGKTVKLEDIDGQWNALKEKQSLYLDIKLTLNHVSKAFYLPEKVCSANTDVGVGIECKADNSRLKYCWKLGSFNKTNDNVAFELKNIEIKNANSDITFSLFFYISDLGVLNENEKSFKFGREKGLILYDDILWKIRTTGNGSVFPIVTANLPNEPLWTTRCDFQQWDTEAFNEDYVSIIINKANPLYPKVNVNDKDFFDINIFNEFISNAMFALIISIMEMAKDQNCLCDLSGEEIEDPGSILAAIRYFKDELKFKVLGTSTDLLESIKKFVKEADL